MLPKRRFWKEEQKMKSGFSTDFSMVRSPNRVLTHLKSASNIRISSFQNLRLGGIKIHPGGSGISRSVGRGSSESACYHRCHGDAASPKVALSGLGRKMHENRRCENIDNNKSNDCSSVAPPNEDFGRPNEPSGTSFRRTFQSFIAQIEYSRP